MKAQISVQALNARTIRKLDLLDSVSNLEDLKVPPGNMFEALKGNRLETYSIRINDQYRKGL
jgi:proteic killer suppression protein